MPTEQHVNVLYPKFGVAQYHAKGFYGTGIRIYVIDTGFVQSLASSIKHVNVRSVNRGTKASAVHGHGSYVASILGNQDAKLPGICPDAILYLSEANAQNGNMYTSTLIACIKDAIQLKVDIISISLGTDTYNKQLEHWIRQALNQGILVLAASGNCGCRTYEFPSSIEGVISVASMNVDRIPSVFNTRNDNVSVFAPGEQLQVPGLQSKRVSGTSFATPFVTGLLALEIQKLRSEEGDQGNKTAITLSTQDAIQFSRETLGLNCNDHTFSVNNVCQKDAQKDFLYTSSNVCQNEGLYWFVLVALAGGLACILLRAAVSHVSFRKTLAM